MATRRSPKGRSAKTADPFVELEKSAPKPVYAIDGEERVLVEGFVAKLLEKVAPPPRPGTSTTRALRARRPSCPGSSTPR